MTFCITFSFMLGAMEQSFIFRLQPEWVATYLTATEPSCCICTEIQERHWLLIFLGYFSQKRLCPTTTTFKVVVVPATRTGLRIIKTSIWKAAWRKEMENKVSLTTFQMFGMCNLYEGRPADYIFSIIPSSVASLQRNKNCVV